VWQIKRWFGGWGLFNQKKTEAKHTHFNQLSHDGKKTPGQTKRKISSKKISVVCIEMPPRHFKLTLHPRS